MSVTTPPPVSPLPAPPVSPLPAAPDRGDRATFSSRATAMFTALKDVFVAQINAVAANVFGNAQAAESAATAASSSATASGASATNAASSAAAAAGSATAAETSAGNAATSAFAAGASAAAAAASALDAEGYVASVNAAAVKATPVDADVLGFLDSAASLGLKKFTFANLRAWTSALGGAGIANEPSGGISSTNVQGALNELDAEKFDKAGGVIIGNVSVAGSILSTSNVIGYGTGAGGTVTQAPSKTASVTLNKPTGRITTASDALAGGAYTHFIFSNSYIVFGDIVIVQPSGGVTGREYEAWVGATADGAAAICLRNNTGASLSDAVNIDFAIIKRAAS